MARDVFTVELISKLLLKGHLLEEDPDVLPILWNEKVLLSLLVMLQVNFKFASIQVLDTNRKLRIGYYDDDGFFPTTPGVRRAVQLAKERLEEAGHELIEIRPARVEQVVESVVSILSADGNRSLIAAL